MSDDVVLRARGIEKTYLDGDIETRVLRGVDLELHKAEFVALMGRSGSGKSTLLSILGTLMRPTVGRVEIVGRDIGELPDEELTRIRSRHIGFVYQFHYLLPDFTALENVMFPSFTIYGRETPAARERAAMLLERVGLADRIDYRATQLSGGQKQRVSLARALAAEPRLIVCDEPTSALDISVQAQLLRELKALQERLHTSLLFISHDLGVVSTIAHRVAVMHRGRIVETGPVSEVFSNPADAYTRTLLEAVPTIAARSSPERKAAVEVTT